MEFYRFTTQIKKCTYVSSHLLPSGFTCNEVRALFPQGVLDQHTCVPFHIVRTWRDHRERTNHKEHLYQLRHLLPSKTSKTFSSSDCHTSLLLFLPNTWQRVICTQGHGQPFTRPSVSPVRPRLGHSQWNCKLRLPGASMLLISPLSTISHAPLAKTNKSEDLLYLLPVSPRGSCYLPKFFCKIVVIFCI